LCAPPPEVYRPWNTSATPDARGVSEESILSSIVAVIAECTAEILDAAEADRKAARRAK